MSTPDAMITWNHGNLSETEFLRDRLRAERETACIALGALLAWNVDGRLDRAIEDVRTRLWPSAPLMEVPDAGGQ